MKGFQMMSITAGMAHPQLHSHDHRVRLRAPALFSIVLEHACTMQDLSVLYEKVPSHRAACSAGVTEWQACLGGRWISLGWDWLRLHDDALVPDDTVGPRSNLMLIDEQGYDLGAEECDAALWQLIRSMPWQADAQRALQAELAH
jgi:hypothetical protein